jgi:hypothetical protein
MRRTRSFHSPLVLGGGMVLALVLGFLAGSLRGTLPARAAGVPGGNGDVNADGKLDLTDPIYLLAYLFQGGQPPVAIPAAPVQTRTAIIVRHAEKIVSDIDDTCLLTPASGVIQGTARAQHLADTLGAAAIDRVFATDYCRTRETVGPAAQARSLQVEAIPDTASVAGDVTAALRALPEGSTALFAGNRGNVPDIILALGAVAAPSLGKDEYDALFVVRFGEAGVPATVVRLQY